MKNNKSGKPFQAPALKTANTMPNLKNKQVYSAQRMHKYSNDFQPTGFQRNKSPFQRMTKKNSKSQNPMPRGNFQGNKVFGENFSDRRIPNVEFSAQRYKKS